MADSEMLTIQRQARNAAATLLYAECVRGAQVDLPSLLDWLADRMVHVYGESPDIDFVLTTRDRAERLRQAMDRFKAVRDGKG